MAQIKPCLKLTFTIFNVIFAIIGGVFIALAVLSQVLTKANGGDEMEDRGTGLVILYLLGISTVVIAGLGAYGGYKESKVCLIVYLVCLVTGGLVILRMGFSVAATRPMMGSTLEAKFKTLVPLDNNEEQVKHMVELLQSSGHCCGLFDYSDWRSIPDSCNCNAKLYPNECRLTYTSLYGYRRSDEGKSIYKEPCFPIVQRYMLMAVDILLGIFFTMAALAMLGVVLSSILIHQMRYDARSTATVNIPAIFTAMPPKYQELQNPPPY